MSSDMIVSPQMGGQGMNETNDHRKIGYKVVCGKKVFGPATTYSLQRIRYRIGQWTIRDPKEYGPFALFETLEEAKEFGEKYGEKILKVQYEPSEETILWKKLPPTFVRNKYGHGYHAESAGRAEKDSSSCPDGAVLAERILPLEICA